jgi:HEAT repeat protein
VPALLGALRDADADVCGKVLWSLRHFEGDLRKLLPGVVPFLKSKDSNERREAAAQLARMGEAALPHLAGALADEDAEVRRLAVQGIGTLGATVKGAVVHLLRGLKDESAAVRWTAAQGLGNLGPAARDALATLEAARSDENPTVRRAVEDALSRIQTRERQP